MLRARKDRMERDIQVEMPKKQDETPRLSLPNLANIAQVTLTSMSESVHTQEE